MFPAQAVLLLRYAFEADLCNSPGPLTTLAQDKHDRFIADQMHWSEFVEEDHKKYEADTYFKVCSRFC